jgi:hypothetical protein
MYAYGTDLTRISSRVIRKVIGSSTPTRSTLMLTGVPTAPRSTFTAWSSLHPLASRPSISSIRSPTRTPPASAGVPGRTPTAVM